MATILHRKDIREEIPLVFFTTAMVTAVSELPELASKEEALSEETRMLSMETEPWTTIDTLNHLPIY